MGADSLFDLPSGSSVEQSRPSKKEGAEKPPLYVPLDSRLTRWTRSRRHRRGIAAR